MSECVGGFGYGLTGCFISHVESREPLCLAETACGLAWGRSLISLSDLSSEKNGVYVHENIWISLPRVQGEKANRK